MRGHITSRCHREQLLACFLLAAHVPRSGAGPGKGFGTSEAGGLAPPASPGRPAQGAEAVPSPSLSTGILSTGGTSYRFGELVRCRSLGRLRGGSLAPPGSYLGCDCRHTQGNRGRAGGRGGTVASAAQGVRVGVPAGAALVPAAGQSQTSGRPPAPNAAGRRVRAAQAEHCPFFLSLRRRRLERMPAPGTLPSRGARHGQGPGSALGRRRSGETRGGRPSRFHLPRSPPLRPFRAGPARSRPGEASAAAPPASGSLAPSRRRGSGGPAGPGAEHGGGEAAAGRGTPSPRACAARPRLRGKKALERASPRPGARGRGRGAGGGAPGRSPERRRGAARWVRGTEAGGPAAAWSACWPLRRRLGDAPASPSAGRSELGGRCSRRRQPGAAGRSLRAIPASRAWPGGGRLTGAGGGRANAGVRAPAGPAAACPDRWASSAAAVTVCLCHVCAAGGGHRAPRPSSQRGRGQRPPLCPPPPRDGAASQ